MLAQPEPTEKSGFLNAMYRYARGLAFAGSGKTNDALAERERMGAAMSRVPEAAMLMSNSSRSVLEIGLADLDAKIARAKNDSESEIAHLRRAVALQDKLNYMEPPEWHYSLRESLGGALLRAGKAAEAEAVFRRDLELNPRNGRALFGLLEAVKMQKKSVAAEWVQKEFKEAWNEAPLELRISDL
jgi:tetratricopeptide (TPR) repeat protein